MNKKYLNIRDSYKRYHKINPDIPLKMYVGIVNGYMKFLIKKLLLKGEVLLPERMGFLQIVGKVVKARFEDGEIKGLAPDWAGTKKLWEDDKEARENKQLAYHFNEDTGGIRYRFFWSKRNALVFNKTLYSLKMTRTNKRILSTLIKEGKEYLIKD